MKSCPVAPRLFLCLLASLALGTAARAQGDWKPVDPAHLALKAPAVEPDADAEALFWEVRADDGDASDFVLTNYLRVKIFTERGRESQSTVELPYWGNVRIKDVAARTIKPSGEIVELKKSDVFDKTIVRASGLKVRAKSFALPAVEPGAIVEYRWREVHPGLSAHNLRIRFQRDIPLHSVTYKFKPATNLENVRAINFQPFRMETPEFVKDKSGFYTATLTNVPAYRAEPHMPPEDEVRKWMLVYYAEKLKIDPDAYWREFGKSIYERNKSDIKPTDELRQKAAEIMGDAQTPEQKLERLYDFCRAKVKNLSDDAAGLTDDDREKLKPNKSPSETLKKMQGTGLDVIRLFAALAQAAGFEARYALTADRSDHFFDKALANSYFMDLLLVAVKAGDRWRFYDPTETYLPAGMLAWQAEMLPALVADKEPVWVTTPLSPPASSVERRRARLRLGADGTLEGEVTVEYTGHAGNYMKEYNDEDSPQQREETLREAVRKRLSTAEFADIRIENVTDPVKPFTYSYKIRVPGYAQRTGKRLFVQPAFFQRGLAPVFPTDARRNDVYFNHPWSEDDTVEIELPEGYALDNADSPESINAGEVSKYEVKLGVTQDGRRLVYRRSFYFGGGSSGLLYPARGYPQLKRLFDELHRRDNHAVTLRQGAAAQD